jgi:Ca2+/Na+ antiporter
MAILLLAGGVVGLLIGVLAGETPGLAAAGRSPGRRAIVYWLPIAVAAVVCTLLGHVEMGIGLAFGTSVAALSAVAGFVALAGPMGDLPAAAARAWSFLPVAALLAFAIGFKAQVGPLAALALLIQGVLVGMIWPRDLSANDQPTLFAAETSSARTSRRALVYLLETLPALALVVVAAWAATRGAAGLSHRDVRYSANTIATTLLSVALAMPLIGMGTPPAAEGRAWSPLTSHVGLVYLNLCLLLPLLILLSGLLHHVPSLSPATAPATLQATPPWTSVLYPRITWRIDALAALILSLLYVPVSAGRLKLDPRLGGWLILAYAIYLLASITAGLALIRGV